MQYQKLGNSGLEVSKICLGAMGFGDNTVGWLQSQWVVNQEETDKVVKSAIDNGINFFDTANIYSFGTSEKYLGNALRKYANREEIVIATKVFFAQEDTPNMKGLSRKAILREVEKSLENLGTDYIDLLIIHRWDYETPIEETMEVLHDLVKSGKVHYIGASAMFGWQFLKAQYVAEINNWTKFISMQNHYNLLYREDERELIDSCHESGASLTPYSPLAGGRLARRENEETVRSQSDKIAAGKYDKYAQINNEIISRVEKLAIEKDVSMAQISLAWLQSKNDVASVIVGATKVHHLEDAIKSLNIELTMEEIKYLEELYQPREISGALKKGN